MSRKTEWVLAHDVEALLPLPLEEVRRRLNITTPHVYNAVPAEIKDNLLKPKLAKTQTERETMRGAEAAS